MAYDLQVGKVANLFKLECDTIWHKPLAYLSMLKFVHRLK